MAMCLRSVNLALADGICASSRINCSIPHSATCAAACAAPAMSRQTRTTAARAARSMPVIIKIEPVVGSLPAMVLEPAHIALQGILDRPSAIRTGDAFHVGQHLEVDIIVIAAAVDAQHEDDRAPEHGGNPKRAYGNTGDLSEELARHRAFIAQRAIGEHADELALIQG